MLHPAEPLSPAAQLALQVLYGARNGALYGCRVRLPHSLLLTALWHRGSLRQKANIVARATATHAARLCTFAALYKSAFYLLASSSTCGAQAGRRDAARTRAAALAGALCGGVVFREPSAVNAQVVMFLFSRGVIGAVRLLRPPAWLRKLAWPLFAAGSWALVMGLWEWDASVLAQGLAQSMELIYRDGPEPGSLEDLLSLSSSWATLSKR